MTRRTPLLLISYLVFLISYFLLPSPINAVVDCRTPPKTFNGPQYQSIINEGNECGLPSPARQLKELEASSVVCLDNPTLIVNTIGFDPNADKEKLDLFKKELKGDTVIDLISYDSFAIKNDKLQKIEDDKEAGVLAKIGKAVTLPDYFDASLYDALCVYEGHYDRTECAQKLDSLTPSQKENLLASGGWWQFANRLENQFAAKKERAKQIVACAQNDPESPLPCDQPYIIRRGESKTSLDLANEIVAMEYEDFLKASPKDQMTILSLRESRAYSAVYLVVKKNTDPTRIFVLSLTNLLGKQYGPENPDATTYPQASQPPQSKIVTTENMMIRKSYIPNVHKTTARAQELYKLLNRTETAQTGLENITKRISTDLSGHNSINEAIAAKISAANLNCNNTSFTYQTAGSQDNYSTTEGSGGLIGLIVAVQGIWSNLFATNQANQIEGLYEAYLIAPTQEIAELMAQDINSPLPLMVKKEYQQSAQEETFIPHQLSDKPPKVGVSATDVDKDTIVPCPDGLVGPCYASKTIELNYAANKNLEGPLPGGEATNWMLYLKGKMPWRKGSNEHFSSTCYAKELSQKTNSGLLASLGTTLFELLGRTSDENIGNCPDDFTASTTPPPLSDDICAIAAAYNIDCGLMKAIYEIETGSGTIIPTQTYGNLNCCNSSDFCGPMQVGGGIVGTISPDKNRDVCTTPDAFELAARWLLIKKWCNLNASTCLGSSNPYEWKENYINDQGISSLSSSETERRTQVEEFIIGWYGSINPDSATISRWGPGKSYVDAVLYYLDNCMTSAPGQCAFFQ